MHPDGQCAIIECCFDAVYKYVTKIQSTTHNHNNIYHDTARFDNHNDGLGVFLERLSQKMSILQSFTIKLCD